MSPTNRRPRRKTVELESLESRRLLAAFDTPWPQPRELSVSFPADGVAIANYTNDLHETLDQVAQRQQWEELALRAYQTWALHADINVGLRNDFDLEFGAPGRLVNDPRFGEFRMGAFPQSGLVASSLPFQTVAGTYSGDLLLDSNQQFTFHDWADGVAPQPSTVGQDERDLFSVLLHESGNTLGLDDTLMDWTVMFRQYTTPKGILSEEDISAIQSLYGARSDPYEQVDNGQLQTATLIPVPVGFNSRTEVIRTRGSLVSASDVDHYKIATVPYRNHVEIRLKAKGISLLDSKIEVFDKWGRSIAQSTSASVFQNDNTLRVSNLWWHSELYVRVTAANPDDVYSVGDYELELDYRPDYTQASDPVAGDYDSGADTLFTNFSLLDDEQGADDSLADVVSASPLDYQASRYELESSVSSATDIDHIKITAPDDVSGRLVVNLQGVGQNQPQMRVRVLDPSGQDVGAAGRLRSDGSWVLEVTEPQANQDYVLRISVDPRSAVGVGNYVVTAEFATPSSQMNHLASGDFGTSTDEFVHWTAGKTKLYRFDLTGTGGVEGQRVQLTVYDAHTREMQAVVGTPTGVTHTAFAWLPQGDYILRFTALTDDAGTGGDLGFTLMCDGLSDDQDENPIDPEDDGNYDPYYYYEYEPYYYYEEYSDPYDYDYYYYYYYYEEE